MEKQMEIFFEKIKKEMEAQTLTITESVTKNISDGINEILNEIISENNILKSEIETLKDKIKFMEDDKRRNNLIFFGIHESEKYDQPLVQQITKMLQNLHVNIGIQDINRAYRLGPKSSKTRPILVSFTTNWKRNEIYRCKNKLPTNIYMKEDYSREMLEKRKELQPILEAERAKGKFCYIKRDRIIVNDSKTDKRDKRKRDCLESPNKSPNQPNNTAPKKINKINMSDYVARGRSSSSLTLPTKTKNT